MSRPPLDVDAQLDESLRRIGGALQHNRLQYATMVEQIMADTHAEVARRMAEESDRLAVKMAEKHQRRLDRWERRAERHRVRRLEERSRDTESAVPRGIVFLVAAVICVTIALRQPSLFWMVFVALGFGMSAVAAFTQAARGRQAGAAQEALPKDESETTSAGKPAEARTAETQVVQPPVPPPVAEPSDPKVTRIQTLCDKLLAELESGPPIVREVVTHPQATIGGLRQACLETARRERELRSVLAAQDEAGLVAERDALATRVSHEQDGIVRERLGQAHTALEQQLAHRAELATAASRLEAENTRILYTLENLHMQLLRARSTDIGAPELGGKLRDSLRELGTQIDAVAEALEWADTPVVPDKGPLATITASGTGPTAAATEQAESAAAARRTAQAGQAQRH
jgi:flagellin-like hook-associated protein FlgL